MAQTTWKQVVLDTADAYREASETTNKIPVGELATKVREGGENVTAELDTQESLIKQIEEILPYKGAGGGEVEATTIETIINYTVSGGSCIVQGYTLSNSQIVKFTETIPAGSGTLTIYPVADTMLDVTFAYTGIFATPAFLPSYSENTPLNNSIIILLVASEWYYVPIPAYNASATPLEQCTVVLNAYTE